MMFGLRAYGIQNRSITILPYQGTPSGRALDADVDDGYLNKCRACELERRTSDCGELFFRARLSIRPRPVADDCLWPKD